MASPTSQPRILMDWFAVSYKSVLLAVAGGLLLLGGGFYAWRWYAPVGAKLEARDAIERAADRIAEADTYLADPRIDEYRGNARQALDEARGSYSDHAFDDARVSAIRAENYAQKAIDLARGEGAADREVKIYKMEGDVRIRRAGEFVWEPADKRRALRVGDQIKTAANASAQLIYFDGTITSVEPGSLLEIRHVSEDPATNIRQVKEKLSWGEIVASTQRRNVKGSFHEVATDAVTARSDDGGTFRISVDKDRKNALFDALSGTLQVAGSDRREFVAEGERLRTAPDGRFEGKDALPAAPRLVAPNDQRIFVHEDPSQSRTTLSWEPVKNASRYLVVIADKPLFSNPRYTGQHAETSVVIDGVAPGEYFWRVAAISRNGVQGAFSQERRFRVATERIRDRGDTTPPDLQITDKVQTGSMLILNGKTEPGAALWVGEEKVEVAADGSFYAVVRLTKEGVNDVSIIAQDIAGNTRKLTHRAYLDPL